MKSESLIVKFFENTLSPEELLKFNALLDSDEDFKKEVAFQKELKEVITLNDRETIKHELKNLELKPQKSKFKIWTIAASIVVLLGISSFWFFGNRTTNPEDLFSANFEPYNNVINPIVRGENSNDLKAKAFIAYEAKNYKDALNSFNSLLNEGDDAAISFYKANVLLQLNKTDEAIAILSNNSDVPEILKVQQKWYLALAYIKANANKKAKSTLKELIDIGNYKKKEAEQLLKQLTL